MKTKDLINLARHIGYVEGVIRGLKPEPDLDSGELHSLLESAQMELEEAQNIIVKVMEEV